MNGVKGITRIDAKNIPGYQQIIPADSIGQQVPNRQIYLKFFLSSSQHGILQLFLL